MMDTEAVPTPTATASFPQISAPMEPSIAAPTNLHNNLDKLPPRKDVSVALQPVSTDSIQATSMLESPTAEEGFEDDTDKKRQRRLLVIEELMETERGYVHDLNNLVRNVFDPLNNAYLAGVATIKQKEVANAASIIQNTSFGNEENGSSWITFDQKQAIIRNGLNLIRTQKLFAKLLEDAVVPGKIFSENPSGEGADPPAAADSVTPFTRVVTGLVPGDVSVLAIARCFQNMMAKLEAVYLPFCSLHDTALDTIGVLRKAHPSQFQAFLDECRAKMNTKLELQDFLIKPVQRICKYPLLLAEILKCTPSHSRDHHELHRAFTSMKQLVAKINEKKKSAEIERKKELLLARLLPDSSVTFDDLAQALGIQAASSSGDITKPFGENEEIFKALGDIIRSSGLLMYHHDDHELPFVAFGPTPVVAQDVDYLGAFLFKDVLLVVFPRRSNLYTLLDVIPTSAVVNVQDLHNDTAGFHESNLIKMRFSWRITWQVEDFYRSVDFGARNDKERTAWLEKLGNCVPPGRIMLHAPEEGEEVLTRHPSSASKLTESTYYEYPEVPITMQAATDLKFADVFTIESLVIGKQPLGSNLNLDRSKSNKTTSIANSAHGNATLRSFLSRARSTDREPNGWSENRPHTGMSRSRSNHASNHASNSGIQAELTESRLTLPSDKASIYAAVSAALEISSHTDPDAMMAETNQGFAGRTLSMRSQKSGAGATTVSQDSQTKSVGGGISGFANRFLKRSFVRQTPSGRDRQGSRAEEGGTEKKGSSLMDSFRKNRKSRPTSEAGPIPTSTPESDLALQSLPSMPKEAPSSPKFSPVSPVEAAAEAGDVLSPTSMLSAEVAPSKVEDDPLQDAAEKQDEPLVNDTYEFVATGIDMTPQPVEIPSANDSQKNQQSDVPAEVEGGNSDENKGEPILMPKTPRPPSAGSQSSLRSGAKIRHGRSRNKLVALDKSATSLHGADALQLPEEPSRAESPVSDRPVTSQLFVNSPEMYRSEYATPQVARNTAFTASQPSSPLQQVRQLTFSPKSQRSVGGLGVEGRSPDTARANSGTAIRTRIKRLSRVSQAEIEAALRTMQIPKFMMAPEDRQDEITVSIPIAVMSPNGDELESLGRS